MVKKPITYPDAKIEERKCKEAARQKELEEARISNH